MLNDLLTGKASLGPTHRPEGPPAAPAAAPSIAQILDNAAASAEAWRVAGERRRREVRSARIVHAVYPTDELSERATCGRASRATTWRRSRRI